LSDTQKNLKNSSVSVQECLLQSVKSMREIGRSASVAAQQLRALHPVLLSAQQQLNADDGGSDTAH
jgi:hypothetical protein